MSTHKRISITLIAMGILFHASSFASITQQPFSTADAITTVDIWWPTDGVRITGTQPFKALMPDASLTNYSMYWQVDDGQWNLMADSSEDYPHKEAWVDLNGWTWKGSGLYDISFIMVSTRGYVIAKKTIQISVTGTQPSPTPSTIKLLPIATPSTAPFPTPTVIVTPKPTPSPILTPVITPVPNQGNPLAGKSLYINRYNDPSNWAQSHRSSQPADAVLMDKIAQQPEVNWFGNWNANVENDVRNTMATVTSAGALPVFVVYNIPQRDCGGYSAGGSGSPEAYRTWIRSVVRGMGTTKAAVLVEPDALVGMECLSQADQRTRVSLIKEAVQLLKTQGSAVYIDAGHPAWKSAEDMASRLKRAGIDQADGFSLNVSNFRTTSENITYGTQISQLTGGKHFIIDTGRNGNGAAPGNEWCNPFGRALGNKPTTNTGQGLVDAYLWVRGPSGSDGQCNGGPSAGSFWPTYGLDLAKNTTW